MRRLYEWIVTLLCGLLLLGLVLRFVNADKPPARLVDVLSTLHAELPTGYPVMLSMGVEDPDNWGESYWDDEVQAFCILIAYEGDPVETLIHEYAHCLTWDYDRGHGPRWGRAYAAAYRVIYGN